MKAIQFNLTLLVLLFIGLSMTSCVNDDDFETPDLNVTEPDLGDGEIVSISSILGELAQSEEPVVLIEDDVYVEGFVISSDEAGNFFEEIIMQDKPENPTVGMRIAVNVNPLFNKFEIGRRILVKMQGLHVGFSNGIATIGRLGDNNRVNQIQESEIDDIVLRTPEVEEIIPLQVSVEDIDFNLRSLFIEINDVQFVRDIILGDNRLTFAAEPDDQFDGERTMESCDSGSSIVLSTSTFADFRFLDLPEGSGSIRGVLSRNFENDMFVLLLNSTEDINFDQERCDPDFLFCEGNSGGSNVIFEEDFENANNINDLVAAGWENVNVTGGNLDYNLGSFSDNNYAQISGFNSNETDSQAWLITPEIDLSTSTEEDLKMRIQTNFNNGLILTIFITNNYTGDPLTTEWTLLDLQVPDGPSSGFGAFTNVGPTNISCAGENVWIGFRYISTDPDNTTRYHIDDIEITGN